MNRGKQGSMRHSVGANGDTRNGAHEMPRPAFVARLTAYSVLLMMSVAHAQPQALKWEKLPPLPDTVGLAGPFAGVSSGALIVAGGANFPEAMPWAGGQKVWHDSIFVLPQADGKWLSGFRLPRPAAYGVSLTTSEGVLCAGGSDAREHFREVFLLNWVSGEIKIKSLPPLPRPIANGCGALLGRTVYLAGGIEAPDATNALNIFWTLDLSEAQPRWRELEPWPGPPRMLAVAAAVDGAFFLVSGVDLSGDAEGKPVRRYLKDAYRFRPGWGWERIADLPRPAVAAPSPAPVLSESVFLVLGGDDGSRVGFQPPEEHPGFPRTILTYHIKTDAWKPFGELPAARVTTSAVKWNEAWVIPSGEARPGVRSPEVWAVHPASR